MMKLRLASISQIEKEKRRWNLYVTQSVQPARRQRNGWTRIRSNTRSATLWMTIQHIRWIENLPRYFTEGNTIFVHAGIDEEAGDMWEWMTSEDTYVNKYPVETGKIEGLDMKVVAGHVGTAEISGDPRFHDIYYDGESHYYIDGTVLDSGIIPVLLVDTDEDKYYKVTESGEWLVQPFTT